MKKTLLDLRFERESMTDDERKQLAEVEQALSGARDDAQDWYKSWCETVTERDAARRYAARWKEVARRAHGMSVAGWYEVGLAWDERHAADQRATAAEAKLTISDIPARRQCDTCSLVHENCVEINTGEGPDRANSATLCGHCVEKIRRELAAAERERDEARKINAPLLRQVNELAGRLAELEAALRFQDPRNASARYDRIADEFYNETGLWPPGRSAPSEMYISEEKRAESHQKWRVFVDKWHERWFDAALSPTPARPATATKPCECGGGTGRIEARENGVLTIQACSCMAPKAKEGDE